MEAYVWEETEYVAGDEDVDGDEEDVEEEVDADANTNPDLHDWTQYVTNYDWEEAFGDSEIRETVLCEKNILKSVRYDRPHNLMGATAWY